MASEARPLPVAVRESSGLAGSLLRPDVLWTHNDRGSEPELFAIDGSGRLLQTVRVDVRMVDWEDLDAAPCGTGSCLYIGDIGDNDGDRNHVTIYRLPEPGPDARQAGEPVALEARFPGGSTDAEALFVAPTGELFVVTKGRRGPVALYRYPAPQRPGEVVTLELVRELFPEPKDNDDRVTSAAATPDGRFVAVRTYRTLYIYDAERLLGGGSVDPSVVDLAPLAEPQGEGLAMSGDATVWLSSEAAGRRTSPTLNRLECSLQAR